jgi:pyruvate carboxylase
MLVKMTVFARTYKQALDRMDRGLHEFRIRGVKTNIPFLMNVVHHEDFKTGQATTRFIDNNPICSSSSRARTVRRSCSATSPTPS